MKMTFEVDEKKLTGIRTRTAAVDPSCIASYGLRARAAVVTTDPHFNLVAGIAPDA